MESKPLTNEDSDLVFEGHHPNCHRFDKNRIKVFGFVICAACIGLLIGAILALICASLYFILGIPFPLGNFEILLAGCVAMLLGLAQFAFRNYLKLIANGLFVVGSLILLISADLIGKSVLIDLYVVGLIVFLLLTRIMLSDWHNRKTCLRCESCV